MKFRLEENVADPTAREALTWKPLRLLSFYRLILAGLLTALFYGIADTGFGSQYPTLYIITCFAYVGFSLLAGFSARIRRPSYETQAVTHVLTDILAITLLIHASGGPASGLGILLIITVATGSLLLPGRMAFLFAAVAALAMFGEHIYSTLILGLQRSTDYNQTGLLGMALFATAMLTYLMARRIHASEMLAYRRGIDIANLAKLNALIVQRLQAGEEIDTAALARELPPFFAAVAVDERRDRRPGGDEVGRKNGSHFAETDQSQPQSQVSFASLRMTAAAPAAAPDADRRQIYVAAVVIPRIAH